MVPSDTDRNRMTEGTLERRSTPSISTLAEIIHRPQLMTLVRVEERQVQGSVIEAPDGEAVRLLEERRQRRKGGGVPDEHIHEIACARNVGESEDVLAVNAFDVPAWAHDDTQRER